VRLHLYDVWDALDDPRTCGQCRSMNGHILDHDTGPWPPLHPGCRCMRHYTHMEIEDGPASPLPAPWGPVYIPDIPAPAPPPRHGRREWG
jgi:hypothetical protein